MYWRSVLCLDSQYSDPHRNIITDDDFAPFGEQYPGAIQDTFFTGSAQIVEANDLLPSQLATIPPPRDAGSAPTPAGLAAVDLTKPQTLNRYVYVNNDPLNEVDPDGTAGFIVYPPSPGVSSPISSAGGLGPGGPTSGSGYRPKEVHHGPGAGTLSKQSPPANNVLQKIKQAYCAALPEGRTISLSGAIGVVGRQAATLEVVSNYNTGEVSGFACGGIQVGWNGAAVAGGTVGVSLFSPASATASVTYYSKPLSLGNIFTQGPLGAGDQLMFALRRVCQ